MGKMIILAIAAFFVGVLPTPAVPLSLEDVFQRCQDVSRAEVELCVLNLINEMQPFFQKGLKELDLGPKDAFPVGNLVVDSQSGNSYIKARFVDVIAKGLHEMHLNKLKIDYPNHSIQWEFDTPEFVASGHYEMDANILFVPLKGKGTFWLRLGGFKCEGITNFTLVELDGDLRVQPFSSKLDFTYDAISTRLNNLFDGNSLLKESAEAFVSASSEAILEEVKPELVQKLMDVGEDIIRTVFRRIPFKYMAGRKFLEEVFQKPS